MVGYLAMSDAIVQSEPEAGGDGWSAPEGDILIVPGDVLGVRLRGEDIGGPFVALLIDLPKSAWQSFNLVDVGVGGISLVNPPFSLDPALVHFGQWIELGGDVSGDVHLAVSCVPRRGQSPRDSRGRPGAPPTKLRCVVWLRDARNRLWAEAIGWTGPSGPEAFLAWCSR